MGPDKDDVVCETVEYVDRLFGEGAGRKHTQFLRYIENDALREMVHRCHPIEGDTTHVSLEENYLLGMAVLCSCRSYATAGNFARVLLHLGTSREKILEVVARLAMWIGPIPAAEAAAHIQRALDDYKQRGLASLDAWFPKPSGP
jgi:hypothetical protein